jgi:hypothetical protein
MRGGVEMLLPFFVEQDDGTGTDEALRIMNIVLDSNILIADFRLSGASIRTLWKASRQLGS